MADEKITELTADILPAAADVVAIVVDTGGTPITRKMTHDDLLFGANGTPSTQAHGDSAVVGTALDSARSDHKHAMPTSSPLVFIGTAVASDSATLTVTGLDTAVYEHFIVELGGLRPATDGAEVQLRMGDSGGIDSGASDYEWAMSEGGPSSSEVYLSDTADSQIDLANGVGSDADEGFSGTYQINTGPAAMATTVYGTGVGHDIQTDPRYFQTAGERAVNLTLTQVQILMDSGNITTGRLTVYGVKHS